MDYDIIEKKKTSFFNSEIFQSRIQDCIDNKGTMLDLSDLGLHDIPNNLPDTLEYLSLSNNYIKEITDIRYLKKLKVLDICGNMVTKIDNIPDIHELSCRHNSINDIKFLESMKLLERLDVTDNEIIIMPTLKYIKVLECSNNRIRMISNFTNLIKLTANDNEISIIDNVPNLKVMDVSNNKLEKIPTIDKIQYLVVDDNLIKNLGKYPKLKYISFVGNDITYLPFYKKLSEICCDYSEKISIDKNYTIKHHEVCTIKKKKISNITLKSQK